MQIYVKCYTICDKGIYRFVFYVNNYILNIYIYMFTKI